MRIRADLAWCLAAVIAAASWNASRDAGGAPPRRLPLRIAARAVAPEDMPRGRSESVPPGQFEGLPDGEPHPADAVPPLPSDEAAIAGPNYGHQADLYNGCCNLVERGGVLGCAAGGGYRHAGPRFGHASHAGLRGGLICCQRGCCPHPDFSYLWDNYGCERWAGHGCRGCRRPRRQSGPTCWLGVPSWTHP
jgi:hypothetical protein